TGTSGNVPNIYCLTKDVPDCKTCLAALEVSMPQNIPRRAGVVPNTPVYNKNRRRNTGAVVRYMHSDGRMRTILIDCGKTFYDASLTWFTHHNLRQIDAVLLTHGHADAMLGLDDLRQWTIGGKHLCVQDHIDVYLSPQTMGVVSSSFPYLVDKGKATGGGDVPSLRFHVFEAGIDKFVVGELEVVPLEVEHGRVDKETPFMSLGFRFGELAYVSDVSAFPERTREKMRGVTTLVLDALHCKSFVLPPPPPPFPAIFFLPLISLLKLSFYFEDTPHASHLSIPQSLTEILRILPHNTTPPARAFLVGFSHRVEHETLERELERDETLWSNGVVVRPAWDGLRVKLRGEEVGVGGE
ncbi:beta-lactamase-like protein, partial [Fimicolochytrium jonesii]|uniref:beta-lactamase-like protein n=1 Tax=Fimicolochytrium jonesii TaxID=1396493 RepID=UPI0022FE9FDE